MKFPVFLPIAIMALLTTASAMSLAFFKNAGDNCSPSADHVLCDKWGDTQCCYTVAPFCVTATLLDGDGLTHTTYFVNGTNCVVTDEPKNFDRCATAGMCCLTMPVEENNNKCSAYWHFGEPDPDPNNPPMPPRKDVPCREPNFLVYTGGDGTTRKIIIPDGEFEQVMEEYSSKDFKSLGRYETLEGGGG